MPPTNPNFTNKLKPARYQIANCTKGCSLNPDNLPGGMGAMVHSWFEAGNNNMQIVRKSDSIGHHLSNGAIGRHRSKHLVKWDAEADVTQGHGEKQKSDLEILDLIIGRGAETVDLATSRVTTEQLIRAIELKQKLTQGSMFQDFFGAIEEESDRIAAAEADKENPEAVESQDEQDQGAQPE
jgi:hypothetical protein